MSQWKTKCYTADTEHDNLVSYIGKEKNIFDDPKSYIYAANGIGIICL